MLLTHLFFNVKDYGVVPSFVDESATVGEEGAVDGVEDSKLSESLHGKEQQETDNHEANELKNQVSKATIAMTLLVPITYHTARATIIKRLAGTDEKTSTDRTTCFPTIELEKFL